MAKPRLPLGLARKLRAEAYRITDGALMRWVMVHELGLRHPNSSQATLDTAISVAIHKGWMTGEGTPVHSVCLTDAGRRLAG